MILQEPLDPSYLDQEDSEYLSEPNLMDECDVLNELPPLTVAQAKKKISSPSDSLRGAMCAPVGFFIEDALWSFQSCC